MILRQCTPRINELIDPLKFANDLCSVDILTDSDVEEIQSTTGISRYNKASLLMGKVKRYFSGIVKEGYFMCFCEQLEKQGNNLLTEISKEMIAKCHQSASNSSTAAEVQQT